MFFYVLRPIQITFEDFGCDSGDFWCHFGPKWCQIGSLLGRFRNHLGFTNSQLFSGFRENHMFEEDKACKGILDGIWADLGAKRDSKWLPIRNQNGANMASNNDQTIRSDLVSRRGPPGKRSNEEASRSSGGGQREA